MRRVLRPENLNKLLRILCRFDPLHIVFTNDWSLKVFYHQSTFRSNKKRKAASSFFLNHLLVYVQIYRARHEKIVCKFPWITDAGQWGRDFTGVEKHKTLGAGTRRSRETLLVLDSTWRLRRVPHFILASDSQTLRSDFISPLDSNCKVSFNRFSLCPIIATRIWGWDQLSSWRLSSYINIHPCGRPWCNRIKTNTIRT